MSMYYCLFVTSAAKYSTYGVYYIRPSGNDITQTLYEPFTVSFDTKTDSNIDLQEKYFGQTGDVPGDLTRSGYSFDDWYTDDGTFVNAWAFDSDTVTETITLYSKWTDINPPTGEIKINNSSFADFQTPTAFELFYKNAVNV